MEEKQDIMNGKFLDATHDLSETGHTFINLENHLNYSLKEILSYSSLNIIATFVSQDCYIN